MDSGTAPETEMWQERGKRKNKKIEANTREPMRERDIQIEERGEIIRKEREANIEKMGGIELEKGWDDDS